jgi:large subunit ribosomal protein L23
MSVNKSLQAVLAPQVTEKATMVADKHNQIAFKVKKMQQKKKLKRL